jgi:hypothetical protein
VAAANSLATFMRQKGPVQHDVLSSQQPLIRPIYPQYAAYPQNQHMVSLHHMYANYPTSPQQQLQQHQMWYQQQNPSMMMPPHPTFAPFSAPVFPSQQPEFATTSAAVKL